MPNDEPAPAATSTPVERAPFAWQPLTPRGVAAFAPATLSRLLLVELMVAMLAAGAIVWLLGVAWFPTIRQAIRHLPEQGAIRGQQLVSPLNLAQTLAETNFLMIVVDLEKQRNATQTSDFLVEFHKTNDHICSIFGCLLFDYPKGWNVEFNRPKLTPWWEAWEPIFLGLTAVFVIAGLFFSWALLATIYCGVVRLLGFFKDRDLNWRSSWRLASAALMPGALMFTAGIFGYGLGVVDLIRLVLLFVLHLVVGWVYLAISPWFVPRLPSVVPPGVNPFVSQ
jgi:hypothetical protein